MPKINLGKVVGDKGDSFTFDDFTQDQLEGITPKILKGNVTTLEPDENATIDIRKEGLNNYVDFGIPRGKNGAEIRNISASNVELAENNTLDVPTYDDTVGTYTTLETSNEAAEQFSNKIKSGASFLTTLSNAKKSLSAIVQGLKILGTNVGAINGITSDINSESTTIAASSKMVHDLNASLSNVSAGLDISSNIVVHDFDAVYFSQGIGIPLYIFCPLNKTATLVSAKVKHYNEQVGAYRNLDLSKIRSYRQGFYVNFRLDMNEIGIPGDYATHRFNVSITVRYS